MSATDEAVIQITGLQHAFKQHRALSGVTFTVNRGAIHGFVGPNGAGKTTTLKILATLLPPQLGQVRVFGLDIVTHYKMVRRRIGFMPDHFSMYRQMTVQEYLDFFAAAYGLDYAERTRKLEDVLALTEMGGRRHDLIKGLSRGMQQRVSLARVLVHDPELLLLDEPASGLDPRARIELMELLQKLQRMGKTIFISSHILSELALLCDSVSILDRGKIKYSGSMNGLTHQAGPLLQYLLDLAENNPNVEAALRAVAGVQSVEKIEGAVASWRVSFDKASTPPNTVLRAVIDSGGEIVSFREEARHLNQAFLDLTTPGVPESKTPPDTVVLAGTEREV